MGRRGPCKNDQIRSAKNAVLLEWSERNILTMRTDPDGSL